MSNRRDTSPSRVCKDKIRLLTQRDMPQVVEHFLRLDLESRRDRFGRGLSDIEILAYAQRLPVDRGVLAGCFPDGHLRGVVEARPAHGDSCHWECVVSVEPDWKRKGLGRKLTESAFAKARKAGASRIYMRCSIANTAGQHFLAQLTRTLREEDGDAVAAVDLSDPALAAAILNSGGGARRYV